jgi:hypothetical protein
VNYTRGLSLSQYASRNFTDRVDATYQAQLGRRLNAGIGFGYQHVDGPPIISGKYYNAALGYSLMRSLSLQATYRYQNQSGDSTQIFTETRTTAFLTLQWDPLHHARWKKAGYSTRFRRADRNETGRWGDTEKVFSRGRVYSKPKSAGHKS